jgi:iron complex outermembrane recepter protein
MWRSDHFYCGFRFLVGLVVDDAALKERESYFGTGQDPKGWHSKRWRIAGVMVLCVLSSMVAEVSRAAEPVFDIDIPAMNAAEALNRLAEQTGSVMLFSYDLARARDANAVRGRYTLLDGLDLLLRDTGLSGGLSDKRVVIIAANGNVPGGKGETVKKRGWLAALIAALFGSTAGESNADQTEGRARQETPIEEIVVTAQKRGEERLQDVPIPVTAIDADALLDSNQTRIQDYYTKVPGLSLTLGGDAGAPMVAIRGVTTGGITNPTVGLVVDEVPYGSSTSNGAGWSVPDIDPSELDRVEVLRGPQGTLYGASSIGGLLKFVTTDPSTNSFSGRLQAGTSTVKDGDDLGYQARGSANVPVSDRFALRASGSVRRDPGYIDNVQTGQDDVNRIDSSSGRLSALWQPTATFSLKLSALLHDVEAGGSAEAHRNVGLAELEQDALLGTGGYHRKTQSYTATLAAHPGSATLTSVTGYSVDEFSSNLDGTPVLGGVASGLFGVSGAPDPIDSETEKFTQELRLSIPLGQRVDWLIGAFYTDEDTFTTQDILAQDPNTGQIFGTLFHGTTPATYEELAAFTNLTFQMTERFDIQVGARESQNRQTYSQVLTGALFGGASIVTPEVDSKDNAFTYLVTPRVKITPDLMVYARLASGYRPGGPNSNSGFIGVPAEYGADMTNNFEVGIKGSALDRALSFEASLYHIRWKDIQLQLREPTQLVPYFDNAGEARSQGAELSLSANSSGGFHVTGWVAWNDAELSEDIPATAINAVGSAGDRLPYSSRFSGNLSLEHDFKLTNSVSAFAGGALSYVGDRKGIFRATPLRQTFESYTQIDLRAGINYEDWTITAFANNVSDKRGVLRGGLDSFIPTYFTYIQPRTVGVSLTRAFR